MSIPINFPPLPSIPPILTKCDKCGKQVNPPLRCSCCKNAFYCSDKCQSADWALHKVNCSSLPPGPLKRASGARPPGSEVADELTALIDSWKARRLVLGRLSFTASQQQLHPIQLTKKQRLDLLITHELKQFMAFRFPPALDYAAYGGHPAHAPYNFKHQLTLIARVLWHDTVLSTDAEPWTLMLSQFVSQPSVTVLRPGRFGVPVPQEDVGELTPPKGVRLFASKVLAKPGELSAGEYQALVTPLDFLWRAVEGQRAPGPGRMVNARCAEELAQCFLQAEMCPELLKYTGEE